MLSKLFSPTHIQFFYKAYAVNIVCFKHNNIIFCFCVYEKVLISCHQIDFHQIHCSQFCFCPVNRLYHFALLEKPMNEYCFSHLREIIVIACIREMEQPIKIAKKNKNYQSLVSIQGPVGYGPTTLPLRHSDLLVILCKILYLPHTNISSLTPYSTLMKWSTFTI